MAIRVVACQATDDWRGCAANFGREGVAVQKGALASKLARRHANFVSTCVPAIRVLPFASVVLLECAALTRGMEVRNVRYA